MSTRVDRDFLSKLFLQLNSDIQTDRLAPFKTMMQAELAYLFSLGLSRAELLKEFEIKKTELNPRILMDAMILDLIDSHRYTPLKQALLKAVDNYIEQLTTPNSSALYAKTQLEAANLFVRVGNTRLTQLMDQVISKTWLEYYQAYPHQFGSDNLEYLQQLVNCFITGGTQEANRVLGRNEKVVRFGQPAERLGAALVKLFCLLDSRKQSGVDLLDKIFDRKTLISDRCIIDRVFSQRRNMTLVEDEPIRKEAQTHPNIVYLEFRAPQNPVRYVYYCWYAPVDGASNSQHIILYRFMSDDKGSHGGMDNAARNVEGKIDGDRVLTGGGLLYYEAAKNQFRHDRDSQDYDPVDNTVREEFIEWLNQHAALISHENRDVGSEAAD